MNRHIAFIVDRMHVGTSNIAVALLNDAAAVRRSAVRHLSLGF